MLLHRDAHILVNTCKYYKETLLGCDREHIGEQNHLIGLACYDADGFKVLIDMLIERPGNFDRKSSRESQSDSGTIQTDTPDAANEESRS